MKISRRYATGQYVRIANRGLKPTATIGGRYATNSARQQLEQKWDKPHGLCQIDIAQAHPATSEFFR
jgi:hypothetical protein